MYTLRAGTGQSKVGPCLFFWLGRARMVMTCALDGVGSTLDR